jgi:hypothetical protein
MARPPIIRIMISSRCVDEVPSAAGPLVSLSTVRQELKDELEKLLLLDKNPLFEVWINEDAPPVEGSADSRDACLEQVRQADIILVLYNGISGWAKAGGDIGICHAEMQTAILNAPAKVRLVEINPLQPLGTGAAKSRNERFRAYVTSQSLFRGAVAVLYLALIAFGAERCRIAIRTADGCYTENLAKAASPGFLPRTPLRELSRTPPLARPSPTPVESRLFDGGWAAWARSDGSTAAPRNCPVRTARWSAR